MNIQNIYNTLTSIKNEIIYREGLMTPETMAKYDKVLEELKVEILSTPTTETSTKQRNKKCIEFAKKVGKRTRSVLQFCDYTFDENNEKDLQLFSNGTMGVLLKREDYIQGIEYWKEKKEFEKATYPNLDHTLKGFFETSFAKINIRVSTLKNAMKIAEKTFIDIKTPNANVLIDKKLLDTTLTFMNVSNEEVIEINFPTKPRGDDNYMLSAIGLQRDNGTRGVICPIKYEKQKEESKGE